MITMATFGIDVGKDWSNPRVKVMITCSSL